MMVVQKECQQSTGDRLAFCRYKGFLSKEGGKNVVIAANNHIWNTIYQNGCIIFLINCGFNSVNMKEL